MEVLLNTIWLLSSVGAFVCWRRGRTAADPHDCRESNILAALALACALLLLFPVISLTDDLHAEQYPMEDSSRSVMKAKHLEQGCLHAGKSSFMDAVTSAANSTSGLNLVVGVVVLLEIQPFCLTLTSSHLGRSPPSTP
jgi:hypothetical protein